MLREKMLADAWLVVKAIKRCFGNDLHQVAISFVILSEHDKVVVRVAFRRDAVIFFLADVELAAQNGFDASIMGGTDKRNGAEDVAVIGHRHGGHVKGFDPLDELLDLTSAIEHGIVGMEMEMDELRL